MTTRENVVEGLTVGTIAGVSALIAISATHGEFPGLFDTWTAGLAALLAGLVRFATLQGYQPPPPQD